MYPRRSQRAGDVKLLWAIAEKIGIALEKKNQKRMSKNCNEYAKNFSEDKHIAEIERKIMQVIK